jgi:hypothetical protein
MLLPATVWWYWEVVGVDSNWYVRTHIHDLLVKRKRNSKCLVLVALKQDDIFL